MSETPAVYGDDQISPAYIPHCQGCGVKNHAVGGRDSEGRFHPVYITDDASHVRLVPQIGKRAWCGDGAPERVLKLERIICSVVEVDGARMRLCERCASQFSRGSEGVAA